MTESNFERRNDYRELMTRAERGFPVVLDGSMGTELRRMGIAEVDDASIWLTRALISSPDAVTGVHQAHRIAGADVITTAAFRTNRRALEQAGLPGMAENLTKKAVLLVQQLRETDTEARPFVVAGNITTIGDTYVGPWPEYSTALVSEHEEKISHLAAGGCDVLLAETMPSLGEAIAVLEAARSHNLPVWLSFVLDSDSERPRLPDGTPVSGLPGQLRRAGHVPDALLLNCCRPEAIESALISLHGSGLCLGAFASLERPTSPGEPWVRREDIGPSTYGQFVKGWLEVGARIVGGCCGTTPEDTAAVRRVVHGFTRGRSEI